MLTLSTKKSLHKPIEVEVDGKVYSLAKVPKSLFEKVIELELTGDPLAGYEQVFTAFGIPKTVLSKLDSRDVKLITGLLTNAILKNEDYLDDAVKNELGLGKTN